jgi:sec-independent protein translocase protein TatB
MFDISWSELLILGLVTLIFVGPKELPRFLGQLGRYMGVVRRQANEFRAVFEQAMREAEMDQIQKEIRGVGDGIKASLDDATRSVESVKAAAKVETDVKPEAAPKALSAETTETPDVAAIAPPEASVPEASVDAASEAKPDEAAKPEAEPEPTATKPKVDSNSTTGPA